LYKIKRDTAGQMSKHLPDSVSFFELLCKSEQRGGHDIVDERSLESLAFLIKIYYHILRLCEK